MVEVRMFWEAIYQRIGSTTFRSETIMFVAAPVNAGHGQLCLKRDPCR